MNHVKVEIWSDVVCPWCYIGKRRFERALAELGDAADVEVVWRSFELDPGAPRVQDEPAVEHLARSLLDRFRDLEPVHLDAASQRLENQYVQRARRDLVS